MDRLHPDIQRILINQRLEQVNSNIAPAEPRDRSETAPEPEKVSWVEQTIRNIGDKATRIYTKEE